MTSTFDLEGGVLEAPAVFSIVLVLKILLSWELVKRCSLLVLKIH